MDLFEIVDPLNLNSWNDTLLNFDDCNIFHTSNWARTLLQSYGYKTRAFISKESNELKFVLPVAEVDSIITGNKGVSMAFCDYCQPLIKNNLNDPILFQKIILASKQFKWKSIEFRGESELINSDLFFSEYLIHSIKLNESYDTINSNYRKNYLSKIKKARNSELTVEINSNENSIEEYYKLHCLTRKRQGMIPQPLSFFRSVFKNIIKENMGVTVIVKKNNIPISGAVFFFYNKKLIYKYGASNLIYKDLFGNFLLFDEVIKWAIKQGMTELSFGRTELNNEGLIQFKNGWGASVSVAHYYKYDLKNDEVVENGNFITGFTGKEYLKKLPVPILRIAGNILYKHVG